MLLRMFHTVVPLRRLAYLVQRESLLQFRCYKMRQLAVAVFAGLRGDVGGTVAM